MRQSYLKRVICLFFPLSKRLGLYQWDHDEFSADTHSVWAQSEHAFKWTFSTYYTRISKPSLSVSLSFVKHYIKHKKTTTVSALLYPSLTFSTFFFKSFPSLTFYFLLVRITKDSFHLLFHDGLIYIFLKEPYITFEFVAAPLSNHKVEKPSHLTALFLVFFFFSPHFRTRRWEVTSWWS